LFANSSNPRESKGDYSDLLLEMAEALLVPGRLVNKVLTILVQLSKCERGVVFSLNPENKLELQTSIGVPVNASGIMKDVCNNYIGEIHYRTSMVYVPDTRKDDKFRKISILKNSDILSFACLPLILEEKVYGLLYLDSTTSAHIFAPGDLERVSRFARLMIHTLIREQMLTDNQVNVPTVSVDDYLAERSIEDLERQQLHALLEKHNWNVTRTAVSLEMPRRTLYNKMAKYGIHRPRRGNPAKTNAI
jgi:transcriptional regulator with GAF, ATPase, and Fis domain